MVCRLFGAKPLSKLMVGYCQWDPDEQTVKKVKFLSRYEKLFIHDNASDNIFYEMAAILSRETS